MASSKPGAQIGYLVVFLMYSLVMVHGATSLGNQVTEAEIDAKIAREERMNTDDLLKQSRLPRLCYNWA